MKRSIICSFPQQAVLIPCGVRMQSCFILLWSTEMELGHPSKTQASMIQSFINCAQMRNSGFLFFLKIKKKIIFIFQSCTEPAYINSPKAIHFLISAIFISGLWSVLVPLWKCLHVFPRVSTHCGKEHAALMCCKYG